MVIGQSLSIAWPLFKRIRNLLFVQRINEEIKQTNGSYKDKQAHWHGMANTNYLFSDSDPTKSENIYKNRNCVSWLNAVRLIRFGISFEKCSQLPTQVHSIHSKYTNRNSKNNGQYDARHPILQLLIVRFFSAYFCVPWCDVGVWRHLVPCTQE